MTLNSVSDRIIDNPYDYLGCVVAVRLHGNANLAIDDIMAELDYNAVGALTDVRRFEWDDTDELYNLIAQSQYQYNARNQITSINHQDSNNNNIVSHGYLYNADGNITQYTNSIDGSVLYDYDFLGQLTGADYSNLSIHDESYQYDLNGNRELVTNANGDLVVYSTGTNNELTSDGAFTYAYDAEGNRISKINAVGTERELYSWDYRNRLESVTKQEFNTTTEEWEDVQIVEYAYDYNNVLIRKVLDANGDGTADSKTLFLPENYQTAVQLDDADLSDSTDATVSHRYLWTPQNQDKLLADIQVSPTGSEILWTLTDHLGTIRDVVKNTPSGLVIPAHIIYDAYGNVLSCKDANGTDIETPVIFGFTGKYFDTDTQLQNNVNRWYDATVGRWLSTDPIGFNGADTNLYRYAGNNVPLYLDVYGLDGNKCFIYIYFGHSGNKAEEFIKQYNNKPNIYLGVLSCEAEKYNKQISNKQRIYSKGYQTFPIIKEGTPLNAKGCKKIVYKAIEVAKFHAKLLVRAYLNSRKNGYVSPEFKEHTNCSSVTIKFICDDDAKTLMETGEMVGKEINPNGITTKLCSEWKYEVNEFSVNEPLNKLER